MNAADLLRAAELGLIEKDEFRKNSLKFGWELWQQPQSEVSVKGAKEKVLR
jgi:hypothetical protein